MEAEGTDTDLVHAARAGDAGALGALIERHRASLYASALSILRNPADAHDAVQDTALRALRHIGDLRDPSAAAGWLRSIVRNACRMRLRSARELPADIDDAPGDLPEPDQALEAVALRDWVWTSLERLSEDLRATLLLRYFSRRQSYAEIAALLGIPVGTVRSRLNQAKTKMGAFLLEATSVTHEDHAALVTRRWRTWTDRVRDLHRSGSAEAYFADCAEDTLVQAPADGYLSRGPDGEAQSIEGAVAAGVRFYLSGIVASPAITILEGDLLSPADDPGHCPPSRTEIRIHPDGQTRRLVLFEGPAGPEPPS